MSADEQPLRAEQYCKRQDKILDWDVMIISYKVGERYYCTVYNISPGAALTRAEADTREQAETEALAEAKELLARTRQFRVY